MSDIDAYELEILKAFESGQLKSIASKSELAKFKAAARASAIKDKRVNIRLSSVDLTDIQVKAMEEGVPYQTLITSALKIEWIYCCRYAVFKCIVNTLGDIWRLLSD